MKLKPFTREEVLELFDTSDSSPSGLVWRTNYKNYKPGDVAGYQVPHTQSSYGSYWKVCFNGRGHMVSRIVWTLIHGEIPSRMFVDHINGNPRDNRISNLCLKTLQENCRARTKKNKSNTSGLVGVFFQKRGKPWAVKIERHGKEHWLGSFTDKLEAARVADAFYIKWAEDHGEERPRILNFPN